MDLKDGHLDQVRNSLAPLVASGHADVDTRMVLAEAELDAGNAGRALELYKKVADEQPGNANALNNTAYLLVARAHQPDEALKYAQTAVELAPGSPPEEHTLGWVLYSKGLYQAALPHLQAAASKDPKAEHLYHFAAACFKTGDAVRGWQALTEATKIDPKAPEAALARAALDQSKR
jgi:tetratricopeptide (TPR) repeat protein